MIDTTRVEKFIDFIVKHDLQFEYCNNYKEEMTYNYTDSLSLVVPIQLLGAVNSAILLYVNGVMGRHLQYFDTLYKKQYKRFFGLIKYKKDAFYSRCVLRGFSQEEEYLIGGFLLTLEDKKDKIQEEKRKLINDRWIEYINFKKMLEQESINDGIVIEDQKFDGKPASMSIKRTKTKKK